MYIVMSCFDTLVARLPPGHKQNTAVHVLMSDSEGCYDTVARLLPGHEHSDQCTAAVCERGGGVLAADGSV